MEVCAFLLLFLPVFPLVRMGFFGLIISKISTHVICSILQVLSSVDRDQIAGRKNKTDDPEKINHYQLI